MHKALAIVLGFIWGVFSFGILLGSSISGASSNPIITFTIALPAGLAFITVDAMERSLGSRSIDVLIFPLIVFYGASLIYLIIYRIKKIVSLLSQ